MKTARRASIRRAIGQARPFRSRAQEAVIDLLRTASDVHARFEALTQAEGLSFQQYNVLRILRAGGPLPTMDIAERLIERTPGITRLIDRLERKGHVRRVRPSDDRRRVVCELTRKGARAADRLKAPVDRLDDACMAALAADELERLVELLDRVRDDRD